MSISPVSVIFLAVSLCLSHAVGIPQDSTWDDTAITPDSFGVLCVDVQRVLAVGKNSEAKQLLIGYLNEQKSVDLVAVEQFQMIFGGNATQPGPDDITHGKLVFIEPTQFDAKSIGKMSGYSLSEKDFEGKSYFAGERDGSWGGYAPTDRTCIFAVERKVLELFAAKNEAGNLANDLKNVSGRSDLYLRFLGGKQAAAMAADLTWPPQLVELVQNSAGGELTINFNDDQVLLASVTMKNEESAKQSADELKQLIGEAVELINLQYGEAEIERLEQLKAEGNIPDEAIESILSETRLIQGYSTLLASIAIKTEGPVIGISYSNTGGAPELLDNIIQLYTGSIPSTRMPNR